MSGRSLVSYTSFLPRKSEISTEELKNSSELSFHSSEVSFHSSEVLFPSSVENFHFLRELLNNSSLRNATYRYKARGSTADERWSLSR